MPDTPLPLGTLSLDTASDLPLYRQLYDGLREAILDGRLKPGARLPSSRGLATELGVGRNTVVSAYEQLTAEGYLDSHIGAGTRVAHLLPDRLTGPGEPPPRRTQSRTARPAKRLLSRRGDAMQGVRRPAANYRRGVTRPFQHGLPDIEDFPALLWSRLLAKHSRDPRHDLFGYEVDKGHKGLRRAIADYAAADRGVVCAPEQVIVTAGAQAALDLAIRMLIDPGDKVWMEDPGYLGARGALMSAEADIRPVEVDGNGMDVEAAIATLPPPRLAYVTASHQFPMGATLSLPRRLALIEHVAQSGGYILEDDYDSEFRFAGRPIASLQGLDRGDTVIYMGTLAKTLFPAIRIGYLIVPPALAEPFSVAIRLTGHIPPASLQAALAEFIEEGHFGAHVRRVRQVYARRRAILLEELDTTLARWLRPAPGEGGLQLAALLPPGADDAKAAAAARRADIHATALSAYRLAPGGRPGLHMGYAGVPDDALRKGARTLATVLEKEKMAEF
ncbi:PLP-dependent aminotransferase family protein [Parvibaculum sp.]|uniref:MocR-like pyridoxine biosynthesis transcription factor PdxR n=1 Tax=Parvibaculum sp. TaxID=2024848 RepID=UPI000C922889|nr:PLP-dependent aminotransferase family protein [Parvibaculum sp.]MAB12877.1 GntR family transcriptional regulator [Parvibaculum sp.]